VRTEREWARERDQLGGEAFEPRGKPRKSRSVERGKHGFVVSPISVRKKKAQTGRNKNQLGGERLRGPLWTNDDAYKKKKGFKNFLMRMGRYLSGWEKSLGEKGPAPKR